MTESTLLFMAVACLATCCLGSDVITSANPKLLSSKVKEIVELSLKYNQMQRHLDTLPYSRTTLPGEKLLTSMANAFANKFQSRTDAVKRLRSAVQTSYFTTTPSAMQCCQSTQLEYDSRFKQPASTSKVCDQISSSADSEAKRLQTGFQKACVENLRSIPSLKWQYFGSEQGVTTQFPATKAADCGSYDNRFRPWYVQANVPKPKQVVIVIDKSGSMELKYKGVKYMTLAIEAAKTVIDTLNPFDQFAVIAFSWHVHVFSASIPNGDCFKKHFAQATPQNKKRVKSYVDTIREDGGTLFVSALHAAFTFFDDNQNNATADRVILFMSDGEPNDSHQSIRNIITDRNSKYTNKVVIMTYGLGGGADARILTEMAEITGTQIGSDFKKGTYTAITTPSMLRNQMASYYNFFSIKGQITEDPVWTVPYLDAWGLGLMVTAALPVYVSGSLAGVAAVDITIEELLAESSFFKPTELSYSFIINEAGLVINHPYFPTVTTSEPLFVKATAFETDPEFQSVFLSMKSGGSGNKTFMSTRVLPQGDSRNYPVRLAKVMSTFYWMQIPGTKFSLCLVLAKDDPQILLQPQGSLPSGAFLYDKFNLVKPPQQCRHLDNLCAKDRSSVALAARAFNNPAQYLSTPETVADVQEITNYMEGKGGSSLFKNGVKDSVVATYKAEQLWQAIDEDDISKHVFWRYVATKEGIFRIFPGTQMPSNYDPVTRAWYEYTQANRDKYVITPPYTDASSGINVVTFSKALYEGRLGGVHQPLTDKLIGAMGVDIVTEYFQTILYQLYPFCNQTDSYQCYVIDLAGFVIMSPSFKASSSKSFNTHLAWVNSNLAAALFNAGIFETKECSNIENAFIQKTFKIAMNKFITRGHTNKTTFSGYTSIPECHFYQLKLVQETNAFLLMVDKTSRLCHGSTLASTCSCRQSASSDTPTCPAYNTDLCTCPCTLYNNAFHPCSNSYTFGGWSPPPCTPEIPDLTKVGTTSVNLNKLEICYPISFSIPQTGSGEKGTSTTIIVVAVVVPIAVILLFIIACCVCHKKAKHAKTYQNSSAAHVNQEAALPGNAHPDTFQPTMSPGTQYGFAVNPTAPSHEDFPPSYESSMRY